MQQSASATQERGKAAGIALSLVCAGLLLLAWFLAQRQAITSDWRRPPVTLSLAGLISPQETNAFRRPGLVTFSAISAVAISPDQQKLLAVGFNGTVLRSTDAGASRLAPAYERRPAPWFWLSAGLLLATAFGGPRLLRARKKARESIRGVSRREVWSRLRPRDFGGSLKMRAVSRGLRWIERQDRRAPLTISARPAPQVVDLVLRRALR